MVTKVELIEGADGELMARLPGGWEFSINGGCGERWEEYGVMILGSDGAGIYGGKTYSRKGDAIRGANRLLKRLGWAVEVVR